MSVTVLLVLGERASQLVDEQSMEQWFSSYIGIHNHVCLILYTTLSVIFGGLTTLAFSFIQCHMYLTLALLCLD